MGGRGVDQCYHLKFIWFGVSCVHSGKNSGKKREVLGIFPFEGEIYNFVKNVPPLPEIVYFFQAGVLFYHTECEKGLLLAKFIQRIYKHKSAHTDQNTKYAKQNIDLRYFVTRQFCREFTHFFGVLLLLLLQV